MFRKLAAAFLALAFAACNAFASAADVEELSKTSAAFQQADRELNAAWKHVPRNSPLVEDQRTWIKSGRDAAAQAYMQSGMGKEQAYVKATSDRTEFLLKSTGKPKSAAQATSTQATSAQTPSARGDMPFGEETPPAPQASSAAPEPQDPSAAPAPAAPQPQAAAPGKVTVEAEGSGESKLAAMKAAWMEAVRKGVGMYMAGSTQLTDDELTEEIVTYSRGQVNSFETLDERHEGGIWKVRIRARIDRDILQETARTSKSQTVDLTKSNAIAAAVSEKEAKEKAAELFINEYRAIDWSTCLDYRFDVVRSGTKAWFAHSFNFNFNNYARHASRLTQVLGKIAKQKKTITLENNQLGIDLRQGMLDAKDFFTNGPDLSRHDLDKNKAVQVIDAPHPRLWPNDSYICGNGDFHEFNSFTNAITVMTSTNSMTAFFLEKEDYEKIAKAISGERSVVFSAEKGEGFDSQLAVSQAAVAMGALHNGRTNWGSTQIAIQPGFSKNRYNRYKLAFTLLQDFDADKALDAKTITGRYTLE